jgi:hypothetical protein
MVDAEGAAARERPPEHDAKPGRLCLQPTGDRGFESCSLQRGVRLSSEPQGCRRKAPHFGGGLRVAGDVRRDVQAANRLSLAVFL